MVITLKNITVNKTALMITNNISLKPYNTLQLDVIAKYFSTPKTIDEVQQLLRSDIAKQNQILILGGGSNILFEKDYDGLIIQPCLDNIDIIKEDDNTIQVEVGAGVEWDNFVDWSVSKGFYGIENLSLIPGNTGASPVQNIGAYGVEVKDVIVAVKGLFLENGEYFTLNNNECQFGYRNSVFKNELKNKTIITSVVFELKKNGTLLLEYGSIKKDVEALGSPTLETTRQAIINVRNSKLPDPKEYGNVGSFFKNPVIEKSKANQLLNAYPDIPSYPATEGFIKIPAGWLIEKSGWKGKSIGNAAVHEQQALVIINKTGKATGAEILHLANTIVNDVNKLFGITLEKEVNVK